MKFNFWIRDRKNDNDDFDIMDDTLIRQTVRDTEVTGTIASMIKKVSEAEWFYITLLIQNNFLSLKDQ